MNSKMFDKPNDARRHTSRLIQIQRIVLGEDPMMEEPIPDPAQIEHAKWVFAGLRGFLRVVEEMHSTELEPRAFEVTAAFIASGQGNAALYPALAGAVVRAARRSFLMGADLAVSEDETLTDERCLLGVLSILCLVYPDHIRAEDVRQYR